MPVLDLTGRTGGLDVRLESGPAFEFLVSLCAFCHSEEDVETFDDGPAQRRRMERHASGDLQSMIERVGPLAGKAWVNFMGLAAVQPASYTVPSLLDRIGALSPLEIRLHLLGYHVPAYQASVGREVIRRAAEGDAEAKAHLLSDPHYYMGEARATLRPLMMVPTEDIAPLAMRILQRWYDEVFRWEEPPATEALAQEADRQRAVIADHGPERAIELVSGIDFVPQPGIRRIVLVPQLAMRPWLLLCEHDDTRLFCYPAGAAAGSDDRARLLRLARALGDPKRLAMLEALATSAARVPDLSARFRLPKSTTYHHLAILRSAGLVKVSSDVDRRYSVRPEGLEEVSRLLDGVIGGRRLGTRAAAGAREGGST